MAEMVSVVMPNFECGKFIADAANSVLGQTYGDLELLIADDCSSDDSQDIIAQIERQDRRVRAFYHREHCGPAVTRNTAIAAARGRYIAFLDSDDVWETSKLARQVPFHERMGCVLSYTAYRKIDETGSARSYPLPIPARLTYRDLLKTCPIGCSTAMYDTRKVGKVFMPLIFRRQDYALWLQLLRNGATAAGCQDCLVRYRVHRGSLSANKLVAARYHWRVLREFERQGYIPAVYYFVHYALRGTARSVGFPRSRFEQPGA